MKNMRTINNTEKIPRTVLNKRNKALYKQGLRSCKKKSIHLDKIGEKQKYQFYLGNRIEGNLLSLISFNSGLINYLISVSEQFIYYKRIKLAKLYPFVTPITHRNIQLSFLSFGSLKFPYFKIKLAVKARKKGNAKECSNYHTIALISHASKVMLKILQARLQHYMNCELPYV